MKSVLFVARIDPNAPARLDLHNFATRSTEKIQPSKDALRLAENVWLLNLEKSVAALGWLISLAEEYSFSYGILPFEKEPIWLPAGFILIPLRTKPLGTHDASTTNLRMFLCATPLPITAEIDARLALHAECDDPVDLRPVRVFAVILTPSRFLRETDQIGPATWW